MNNDPKSAKPNASYINGRAYDGKTPLKQKPASRPASALRDGTGRAHEQKSASHADPARRTPASPDGKIGRASCHHRSRSKKKKVVKSVLKNYGLTAAAIVGVIVIIAVIIIFSSRGGKYQEGEVHETQTSNYDNLFIDYDLV